MSILGDGGLRRRRHLADGARADRGRRAEEGPGAPEGARLPEGGRPRARRAAGGRTTYGSGVLIMFLTEMFRPESASRRRSRRARPRSPRRTAAGSARGRAWIQDLASFLVRRADGDGLVGLPRAAARTSRTRSTRCSACGPRATAARPCPHDVREGAAQRALEWQEQDGPKVKRIVPSPEARRASPYVFEAGDRARGCPYLPRAVPRHRQHDDVAASRVLAIAHDALHASQAALALRRRRSRPRRTRAIEDGVLLARPELGPSTRTRRAARAELAPLLPLRPRARVRARRTRGDRATRLVRRGRDAPRGHAEGGRPLEHGRARQPAARWRAATSATPRGRSSS